MALSWWVTENRVQNPPNYSGSVNGVKRCVCACVRTLLASSLKKFRARLVMWGSGSISNTATSLTWPLTLSTSLSTNWVRTVTAVCLTEGTSSLSLEKRTWNYWLNNFRPFLHQEWRSTVMLAALEGWTWHSGALSWMLMSACWYLLICTKKKFQLGLMEVSSVLQVFGH